MIRRGVVALLAAAALGVSAGSAAAAEIPNHPFKGTLVGGLASASPPVPLLEDPCGVAVNAVGDVYVADYYHHQIGRRNHLPPSAYAPVLEDVATPNGPCGLAIGPGGDLFVNHWHGPVVRYAAPGLTAAEVVDPRQATGVAVDRASGDLYVDEGTSIAIYEAPIAAGEEPDLRIGAGTLEQGYGVAYSTATGTVAAADAADDTVKYYDPSAPMPDRDVPVRTISGAGTPQGGSAGGFVSLRDSSLAIDQSNDHLFVADNLQPGFEHPQAAIDEFNGAGLFRGALRMSGTFIDSAPVGIAVDESLAKGNVYVTTGNGQSDALGGYDPALASAVLSFGPAGAGQVLEVSISGAGSGSVLSSPAGIACPGACAAEYNSGATVTLTASPAPGSVFAGWSGPCTGTGSCKVELNAAAAVGAEFTPAPSAAAVRFAAPVEAVAAAAVASPARAAKRPPRAHRRFRRGRTIALPRHRRVREKR